MTAEEPLHKKLKGADALDGANQLTIVAKKSSGGNTSILEVHLAKSSTVEDLALRLAEHEHCDGSAVTLVCRGAILNQATVKLETLVDKVGSDSKLNVVYLVRKQNRVPATAVSQATSSSSPASASSTPRPIGSSTTEQDKLGQAKPAQAQQSAANSGKHGGGRRVILLLRHGQCQHEGQRDELKALTSHGHQQADESAKYVARLFETGGVPEQRALLHSTSRRARETAARLPVHLPGIQVWNADLLRETDPTANPMRAEDAFQKIFISPEAGASDTLIVVAHNNIILYLLMRAAGVPTQLAAQAWHSFHLRHTSVTRVDISETGVIKIVAVGAAGHIPKAVVTWNNIEGADMSAWKGGAVERHKFSGRMLVLVRQVSSNTGSCSKLIKATAEHVKSLGEYMISTHWTLVCTTAGTPTGTGIAEKCNIKAQTHSDSIVEQPEAAFLQYFCLPTEHNRDTVVLVADDGPLLYCLLRALQMSPEEAQLKATAYCIDQASVTLVNVKSNGNIRVVSVGDNGHLPMDRT